MAVGDSTKLDVSFHTKKYRGKVSKHPYFITNECPDKIPLTITATVAQHPDSEYFPLKITPPKVYMSPSTMRGGDSLAFTIENLSDSTLHISVIDLPDDYVKVRLPAVLQPHESATAVVRLNSSKRTQSFFRSVTIEVDDDARTRFTIPIQHTYVGP